MRLQRWHCHGQLLDLAACEGGGVPIALDRDNHRCQLMARVTGVLTIYETLEFLHTARADPAVETWPLLFDTRGATTSMTPEEVEAAVAVVDAIRRSSTIARGHVAIIADDDRLYARMVLFETLLNEIGVRSVRAFRQSAAAERWLSIMRAGAVFLSAQRFNTRAAS
jgi:hypothetical protein